MRRSTLAVGIGATLAALAFAAGFPTAGAAFTFKRATPPPPDAERRITVQIAPTPETPAPDPPPEPAPGPRIGRYAWYWDGISPALADAGPGRLGAALAQLRAGPQAAAVPAPQLHRLRAIAATHGSDLLRATAGTAVSPAFALAVIAVESAGDPAAISPAGAAGLMQLMPATAARFDVARRTDPAASIRGGVAYLDTLMGAFDRDPLIVLAAYNAGEQAVRDHAGVPPYAETRDYVPRVLAAWQVARDLCRTPPVSVSDGCVFRLAAR